MILAACALCGVNEVYRMGGAQAIAALAYGTESVPSVDVIAGPGNAYVQEAKRQVVGQVGIDGIAGPSELVVVASIGADPELIALDLLAQAEHGTDSLLAVISDHPDLLDAGGVQRGGHGPCALQRARRMPSSWCCAPTTSARRFAWPRSSRPSTSSWSEERRARWRTA